MVSELHVHHWASAEDDKLHRIYICRCGARLDWDEAREAWEREVLPDDRGRLPAEPVAS